MNYEFEMVVSVLLTLLAANRLLPKRTNASDLGALGLSTFLHLGEGINDPSNTVIIVDRNVTIHVR